MLSLRLPGPVTFDGKAVAKMGIGISMYFNSGKTIIQLYGSITVDPTVSISFEK